MARGYCGGVTESSADRLFADPSLTWERVSPALLTERRLVVVGPALAGVLLLVWGILGLDGTGGLFVATVGTLLLTASVWGWFVVIPKIVSSWRYAEREQDLLVSRGRMLRRLTVVPYGRMQVIEVSANPVSRRLGIATLSLVTASAATDARIPGVPADVAQELRDRLAAKGEAAAAGL
jgi:membrane protein YdbS with pleckstrin-like domain